MKLVGGLERSVIVRGPRPRHVDGARNVPRYLGLLAWQVVGCELLPAELLRRAYVHEPGPVAADGAEDVIAHCPDAGALWCLDPEFPMRVDRYPGDQLATLQLPLLAAPVEQPDRVETAQPEDPVRVRGEPVVVAAVKDHGGVVADRRS